MGGSLGKLQHLEIEVRQGKTIVAYRPDLAVW